jgi:ABC-type transporter Mla MlaB component
MPRKPAPSPRSLALEGDLDLFSIHAQWEQLVPLAAEGGPLELDLKGIGDLDLSGLQLLSALERDLKEHGGRLALTGTRAEWLPRFELLGMASLFEERTP